MKRILLLLTFTTCFKQEGTLRCYKNKEREREREKGKINIERGLVSHTHTHTKEGGGGGRKAEPILTDASLVGNTILMKSMTISNVVLSHINHKHLFLE